MNEINRHDFLPSLVYKLNNSLTAITEYCQLLIPKMVDPEDREELEKVVKEAENISEFIKNLTIHIRKEKLKKETVNLNELVEQVLKGKMDELDARNIRLARALTPSMPAVQADRQKFCHVLLNLINNAEEAISKFHGFGEIVVKTRTSGDQVEIIISDDGPGIANETLPRIFDPFFTTEENGIGLGLAISYEIITAHGGTMRVKSEWGKGAAFSITLPFTVAKDEAKKEKEKDVKGNLRGLKGLVIDDDCALLDLVYKYLKLDGCEVITTPDVNTAIDIIEEKEFDFVICDIKMPGLGGSDFYYILKEKKPSLKDRIIFSTGDILGDMTKRFIDSVSNLVVEKPFNLSELKEAVLKVVG